MRMPALQTERLLIRELDFDDLPAVHQLLDVDLAATDWGEEAGTIGERRRWLESTVLGYEQLAKLRQPPFGDRAIVLKGTGELAGACGFVRCLGPVDQSPAWRAAAEDAPRGRSVAEDGLY